MRFYKFPTPHTPAPAGTYHAEAEYVDCSSTRAWIRNGAPPDWRHPSRQAREHLVFRWALVVSLRRNLGVEDQPDPLTMYFPYVDHQGNADI